MLDGNKLRAEVFVFHRSLASQNEKMHEGLCRCRTGVKRMQMATLMHTMSASASNSMAFRVEHVTCL